MKKKVVCVSGVGIRIKERIGLVRVFIVKNWDGFLDIMIKIFKIILCIMVLVYKLVI